MKFRCIIAEEEGNIVGYLPFFILKRGPVRMFWSMPYGTYGGPVTFGSDEVYRRLVDFYVNLGKNFWNFQTGCIDFWDRDTWPPFRKKEALTHIIDLKPGFDQIWSKSLDKSKRKQAKRAERSGIRVIETAAAEDAKLFYRFYVSRVKNAGGKIHYPEPLFVELVQNGGESVKLFLLYHEQEPVGGQLSFYFKDMVIAWYGTTTLESRKLKASTALYTFCIRHACDSGYKRLNLGGSMGKDSLMDYKMSFGGIPHRYGVSVFRSPLGKILGKAVASAKRFTD
jgi:lipid II:glycine glycyltransferase (peptidoglycan interpeptide bridge formation enzyme)